MPSPRYAPAREDGTKPYVVTRPEGGALSTGGMAAAMTWKQAEILVILGENGGMVLADLGDLIREIHAIDLAAGNRPMYWGVDNGSIRSCLQGLARRDLAFEQAGKWTLTFKGMEAANAVR